MTPFYKCFQNCMCSFREKWVINLIIWHSTLPYFNPLLITVPLKSKVPFRRNSEIKWPTANSSVAWLLFCWMRNIVHIFHFSGIPVKTHAKEISRTPRKRPWRFCKKIIFFKDFIMAAITWAGGSFVCIFMYSQFDFRLRILDVKRFKNYQSRGLIGGQLVTMVTTLFNHLFKLLNCFLLYLGYWLLLRKHKKCITEIFGNILFFRSCPTNKSIFKGSNKKHVKHRKRC